MIGTKIVHLFVVDGHPELFAYKLHDIQLILEGCSILGTPAAGGRDS